MLTCKQTARLVSLSYDKRLSWRERLGVRLHLLVCDACRNFGRQMRFLRAAARRFAREQPETDQRVRLSPEALERITRALKKRVSDHRPGKTPG
jgi:predicted anti-sigma-YlaC factor YlaD